jgi:hypothetical protein
MYHTILVGEEVRAHVLDLHRGSELTAGDLELEGVWGGEDED